MLNPDGVINGHYRTSLHGDDLNRHWDTADAYVHPTIHRLKALMTELQAGPGVALFCDLHGHVCVFAITCGFLLVSPSPHDITCTRVSCIHFLFTFLFDSHLDGFPCVPDFPHACSLGKRVHSCTAAPILVSRPA